MIRKKREATSATEEAHAYQLYRHLEERHGVMFTPHEARTMTLHDLAELHALHVSLDASEPCLIHSNSFDGGEP